MANLVPHFSLSHCLWNVSLMYANQLHNQTNKTPTFGPSAYLRAKFAVQFRDICVNSCLTRSHTKSWETNSSNFFSGNIYTHIYIPLPIAYTVKSLRSSMRWFTFFQFCFGYCPSLRLVYTRLENNERPTLQKKPMIFPHVWLFLVQLWSALIYILSLALSNIFFLSICTNTRFMYERLNY